MLFVEDLLTKVPGLSREFQFIDGKDEKISSNPEDDIIDFRNILEEIPNLNLWPNEPAGKNTKFKSESNFDAHLNAFEETVIPKVGQVF